MAEWRLARGWSSQELSIRLDALADLATTVPDREEDMTPVRGFSRHHSQAVVAREPPGDPVPDGPFERATMLVTDYEFSDPRIVTCHFDPMDRLLGRRMLLELRVPALRYLNGVVVSRVRRDDDAHGHVFGFRYDTLEGHIESGAEWFLLTKDRETGDVRFSIDAAWRLGDFPNWWSRVGFELVGRRYQRAWHRLAYVRLRALLASADLPPLPSPDRLVHEGRALPVPSVQVAAAARPSVVLEEEDLLARGSGAG